MTEASARQTGEVSCDVTALSLADWLRLAAAPIFAFMALLTALGRSPIDQLCSSGHGAPVSGMVVMYLLMSAFHAPPWLSLRRER